MRNPRRQPQFQDLVGIRKQTTYLQQDGRICPGPGCKAKTDIKGDHELVCSHAPFMGSASPAHGHKRQVTLLFDNLPHEGLSPVLILRKDDLQESRADIRAIGNRDGDDIIDIDIDIAHPFASEATANRTFRNSTTTPADCNSVPTNMPGPSQAKKLHGRTFTSSLNGYLLSKPFHLSSGKQHAHYHCRTSQRRIQIRLTTLYSIL